MSKSKIIAVAAVALIAGVSVPSAHAAQKQDRFEFNYSMAELSNPLSLEKLTKRLVRKADKFCRRRAGHSVSISSRLECRNLIVQSVSVELGKRFPKALASR